MTTASRVDSQPTTKPFLLNGGTSRTSMITLRAPDPASAIMVHRRGGAGPGRYNASMVLVAVDDLLFSSKIRATGKQAGVELAFARSRQEVLDQARALNPPLVIFDLNSGKIDSIAAITAMKQDPELAGIRTLGFVSHVDAGAISAARNAGTDQVMARSAFAAQLADILLAGGTGQA